MNSQSLEGRHQKSARADDSPGGRSGPAGGFAKGTRVHTKEGLKPIEVIAAGDYVLSRPAHGAEGTEYKRVLNTFIHKKTIKKVNCYGPKPETQFFFAATGSQLFWVEGKGWTPAERLKKGNVLYKADGSSGEVATQYPVYRTKAPGVGWVQAIDNLDSAWGSCMDYENYDIFPDPTGEFEFLSLEISASDHPYLEVTVYHLEVEDAHTYFVGSIGVWVHDSHRPAEG